MALSNYLSRASKSCLLSLSLLAFCIDLSAAATIPSGQSLAQPANLTASLAALDATTTTGRYHCTRDAEFNPYELNGNDCLAAIEKLRRIEETTHNMHKYQFREPPSYRLYPQPDQQMPRRYVSGSCMVQLVMMRNPALDGLQGRGKTTDYKEVDIGTFHDIWKKGAWMAKTCLQFDIPGFITAGRFNSIGVFLWATDSEMARRIPAYEPPDVEPGAISIWKSVRANSYRSDD